MTESIEEQITVTGTLINVTLFEDKIMRNFLIISNKLRKLEGLMEMEQKQRALQKQFKFLSMKVDTIVQKLPKDSGGSLNRSDARNIAKQAFFDVMNSEDEKLTKSKFNQDLLNEIKSIKDSINNTAGSKDQRKKKDGAKTSFTAGQILRENEKEREDDQELKMPRQSLQNVLDEKEMQIVTQIVEKKGQQSGATILDLNQKIQDLYKIVQELRLGRGYASFLERQAEKFERFQQYEQKSRQTAKRHKQKPIQLQGIKAENVRGQLLKSGLLSEMQKMQLNKQQIARQQLMQRKTIFGGMPRQSKRQSKDLRELKDSRDGIKQRDPFVSTLRGEDKQKEGFKRSHSIRKLQKLQKRLRVDDLKQLNGILREIQLRIQSKVSHDIFMGLVKDLEQKIEAIRISKDSSGEVNEIRKNIFVLESKVQSVVGYLQSISQQDDALIVRKQWTCVSCDKGLEKYQGKVGQHLNWDSVASKKISPTKVGAFGQTGQLAAKIRNLMDGKQGDE